MRIGPGELAAPLGRICRETDLGARAAMQALNIGKNAGYLEVQSTPWALRIKIVNWQEHLRTESVNFRHCVQPASKKHRKGG